MRRIPALAVAVAAASLLLAGCTSNDAAGSTDSATNAADSSACATDGSASKAVTVTGDFGAAPTTSFQGPLTVDSTERTVVSEGDGEALETGSLATIDFTIYNGTTGDKAFSTLDEGGTQLQLTVDATQYIPGIVQAVNCATVGSRVVAVIPPADAFGDTGNQSLGIGADDSMVMVADIEAIVPTRAEGVDQPAQDGFPSVTLDDSGAPTVSIPSTDAPAELKTEVLKKGDGPVVGDGDSVTVQYQGVIWGSGQVFDQSWGQGGPRTFQTTGVVSGFAAAMIGQTVGSQVLVIIPPDQGYGSEGNSAAGISGTDTLVFVIDILATASA
ncbi:FKBP-type peptidyl-prolyl cis-trans isomerase [Herbiconiux sp. KACC 21604]|uniref:FKBP-type peptidyl-prolyl cis-trans isomerase n=1 Tax=unclassified Herbiconiux TaxID=2618217 RepID=UPI001490FC16|nr:FKBP-type peptidyl-prolyl cis-trans isomerase [Herbiconiux sp. SALV-R1]QJU53261.1 peptidylprolyl isomerase [Herbiconiux sp. SALV-R1]WPO88219.1 FKBP-type peptidyl-prolyl cis-trans isomerase [Herbiconiux sp. KACC 21604]